MEHSTLAVYLQPILLGLICAITGFSAWQMKKWMERIERDHQIFYSRINSLDQFAATFRDESARKNAALDRLFGAVEDCGRRVTGAELGNAKRDERLAVMEKRVEFLERDKE